ncbi:MAG: DUF58 domain-containing protein [Candidatus Kapabacteria bacterium]|nr:DUF58 domain-containing protein [Candidatus Kapabacteria bacterium]
MDTQQLIKKVRKLEIKTRGLSNQMFSGEYHTAFKGRGMTFSEVRQYYAGDDIRTIDWNVTARTSEAHIKVFEEERELTMMLLVDVSASGNFGTSVQFKRELITELCAILSFSALQNNDKIGVIFFTDKVEKYIPPKKGKTHVLRVIRELIEFQPVNSKTDISEALKYFSDVVKKRSIAFIMSDFISSDFEKPLKIASRKHDTIAMQVYDKRESEIPNLGLVNIKDAETGELRIIDTSSKSLRDNYKLSWENRQTKITRLLNKCKVDLIQIRTDESYIVPLRNFFKTRGKKR